MRCARTIAILLLVVPLLLHAKGAFALISPRLEVEIPFVEFTDPVQEQGLTVPFLAQYVSGVYKFLISIVGVLASVMIAVGGFQYLTAGGDKARVDAGKERMQNAIIGMILALASYTLLYSINPDTVSFRGLELMQVKSDVIVEDYDPGNDQDFSQNEPAVTPAGFAEGAKAFCTRKKGDCPGWCKNLSTDRSKWPKTTPGYMPRESTIVIPDHQFNGRTVLLGNSQRAHPTVAKALADTAEQMAIDYPAHAYVIKPGECHRTVESQISKVCVPGVGIKQKGGKDVDYGSAVANPGGSNHGVGYACDLHLYEGKKDLLEGHYSTSSQCKAPVAVQKLFDAIMFKKGWVRYDREIWHYEYGTPDSVGNRCGPGHADCSYPPAHYCS